VGDEVAASQALEKLGSVLATTVRYDEALVALERAADIHGIRNDPEGAGRVEARIAQTHFRRGTREKGIARLASYLELLDKPGATEGVRRSLAVLSTVPSRVSTGPAPNSPSAGTRLRGARASPAR